MASVQISLIEAVQLMEKALKQKFDHPLLPSIPVTGAAVDSRLVQPGNLFFALPGEKTDGHHFLEQAAAHGAAVAVVSTGYQGADHGLTLIKAEDGLLALQGLARALIEKRKPQIVAVTGSLGKTTTKEFITTLLQQKYRVAASPGNSNSQTGLPLSVINHTTPDDEMLVLEMGMTTPGHISRLVSMAPPDIAVITSVELVHICNFNSIEDIARTKAEIFSNPKTRLGIISKDIPAYDEVVKMGTCRKLSFSLIDKDADFYLTEKDDHLRIFDHETLVGLPKLNIPGRHNLHNFLAAYAVARSLHLSRDEIAGGMQNLRLYERRLQRIERNGIIFINDSYNAAAASIKAALQSLPAPQSGRKTIAVIGQMGELGSFSEACHRDVGEAALACVDDMICYGEGCHPILDVWRQANRPAELFTDFAKLFAYVWKKAQPGDVVLLKGSKFNKLWQILD